MCGFAGFIGSSGENLQILNLMLDTIIPRGPDDVGYWTDKKCGVFLGHRRLSIIDRSDNGKQPMTSRNSRFTIIFNGEIYNHLDIRKQLSGILFQGGSDTETLLESIAEFGLDHTLANIHGMFAFAVWDRKREELTLVRDRVGEKPLYYGFQDKHFLFGSELKALKAHPSFMQDLNRSSLTSQIQLGYVPTPLSIYENVYKVEPGTYITFQIKGGKIPIKEDSNSKRYWDLKKITSGSRNLNLKTKAAAMSGLDCILNNVIKRQMVADVPLGCLLSGGVDSSLVSAIMQANSQSRIKTFSIGFDEKQFNEADHAARVAKHLNTEHTELYVTSEDALNVIPDLPRIFDEPFADSSQIPTFLVSKLARESVTVALTGDGADELFGGYNRYIFTDRMWGLMQKTPTLLRKLISKSIKKIKPKDLDILFSIFYFFQTKSKNDLNLGDKLYKLSDILSEDNLDDFYTNLIIGGNISDNLVLNCDNKSTFFRFFPNSFENISNVEKMMAIDTLTYLPDDILVKVDRAAMANSLETRAPFLDHGVIEFAWALDESMKFGGGRGKLILRELLYNYVPQSLIDRPKMGFGVPLADWLRGPIREWAEELLDENKLVQQGYLNAKKIRRLWHEHQTGNRNYQKILWHILMFQSWLENQKLR